MNDIKKLQNDPLPLSPRAERIMKEQQDRAAAQGSASAKPSGAPAERDPKMLEAARSFENQFIRQIISEMRKTVPKDELVGESMTESVFRDQLDGEYADSWVNQGGTGLADMIYDQLYEKYGSPTTLPRKAPGEALQFKSHGAHSEHAPGRALASPGQAAQVSERAPAAGDRPRDILATADKNLFLAKREQGGFVLKSREPLPEAVGLRSPLSGVVLQAAALEDGRQMLVVKHDQGLVSQFVHTGRNRVAMNTRVDAGQVIAELPPSLNGETAKVFFGLQPAQNR